LGLGTWDLELGTWSLGLGTWESSSSTISGVYFIVVQILRARLPKLS